jgi:anti-anti-sigma regulatory factor
MVSGAEMPARLGHSRGAVVMHRLLVPASSSRDCSVVAVWIAEAVGRGEKVLYKHAPSEDAVTSLARSLPTAGVDPVVLTTGQVQLADTTELHIETGGLHQALYALHEHQRDQASREGFAGLAMTGDAAAMHSITRDEGELARYERALERLATVAGVHSLCRYALKEHPGLLNDMLAVHYREVADDVWSAEVVQQRLRIIGELDFSNAGRLTPVMHAALGAGIRVMDVSELAFCDVAGARAIVAAAETLSPATTPLTLTGVDGLLATVLGLMGGLDSAVLQVSEREADT